MDIKTIIDEHKFTPDVLKDQYFLIDNDVILELVKQGKTNKQDVVLEIGAGFGNITTEIAKKAKKVIAYEIDKKFRPFLNGTLKNVNVIYADAWDYLQPIGNFKQKKEFNKIISNLPYSFSEKLIHALILTKFDIVVLLVPLKFVNTLKENPIFNSFFSAELIRIVNKKCFYPMPKTNSALIVLKHLEDPIKAKNLILFLKQYVYFHNKAKLKNSLMEGLILFSKTVRNKILTKNMVRNIIQGLNFDDKLLNELPVGLIVYKEIEDKFSNIQKVKF